MEHRSHSPEGGEHHHETHEAQPEPIFEQLSDEQRIQRGIADALNEGGQSMTESPGSLPGTSLSRWKPKTTQHSTLWPQLDRCQRTWNANC